MQDAAAPSSDDDVDWQQVYTLHAGRLRRVVAKRVAPDAIDDVLQETFLRAYRSRHRLDTSRPLEPWLTTIAIRVAADRRRTSMVEPHDEREPRHVPDVHDQLQAIERDESSPESFERWADANNGCCN